MKLDWLSDLIRNIPKTKAIRKNFIAIAGYPKWENVNSNLLAFYFDEKEEHGFGRLFFDSLIDIYFEKVNSKTSQIKEKFLIKREILDSDFQVEREVYTPEGNRVDLVIKEAYNFDESEPTEESKVEDRKLKWAIIVENKIDASIDKNDLIDYWNVINSENRIGIVLSIKPITDKKLINGGVHYENILHKELVEGVQLNLSNFYLSSDDRHLLFLKEYINNINSHYMNTNNTLNLDNQLELFQKNGEEILELKRRDDELLKYVYEMVVDLMEKKGFKPDTSKANLTRFFYVDENPKTAIVNKDDIKTGRRFRFWVNLEPTLYGNSFRVIFELWGKKNTKFGDTLKSRLLKKEIFTNKVRLGEKGNSNQSYQHIYDVRIPIKGVPSEPFSKTLEKTVEQEFFQKNFIGIAIEELKEVIKSDKST